ncbi:hypothetical protein [Ruminococcus sp. Marseille-P6503]|uniref:hypothetical protein n=1 Tax=Ruminococcus sp. Marseille-P6503 TaxID=2364796 RepID=UPI000F52218A|nr:hypothetical protein [Ruminococcus sp. Marseille-P6503]
MKKLLIGLFFITLDISVGLGTASIELIPDFIGYFILMSGLKDFSQENENFSKAQRLCIPLAAAALVLYVLNIFGFSYSDGESLNILPFAAELLCVAGELYVTYQICQGTEDIERRFKCDLNYDKLKLAWSIMAAALAGAYLSVMIPVVSACCVMISFAFAVVFLVQFNTARLRYNYFFHKD